METRCSRATFNAVVRVINAETRTQMRRQTFRVIDIPADENEDRPDEDRPDDVMTDEENDDDKENDSSQPNKSISVSQITGVFK